jgi:hypothetical protein
MSIFFHLHHRIERALGGSGIGTGYRSGQSDRRAVRQMRAKLNEKESPGLSLTRRALLLDLALDSLKA